MITGESLFAPTKHQLSYQIVCTMSYLRRYSSAVTSGVFVKRDEVAMILSSGLLLIVSSRVVESYPLFPEKLYRRPFHRDPLPNFTR